MPLLNFEENDSENELNIFFSYNVNNMKYIEDCHLKIKNKMPKLAQVKQKGKSSLLVSNLNETNFKVENLGNGTLKILGFVENLEIVIRS